MTTSYWKNTAKKESYPSLDQDMDTEVLIVGGGITGLMAAWCLLQEGRKAVIVEGRQIGSGVTGHTTAHLTTSVDLSYQHLAGSHSKEAAKLVAEAALTAINLVGEADSTLGLDAHYKKLVAYEYAETDDQVAELQREFDAAREAGVAVEWLDSAEGLPFKTLNAIRYKQNARFHPLRFLYNMAEKLRAGGVQIYEDSQVVKHDEKSDYVEVKLSTGATISAQHLILATHSPLFLHPVHTRIAPYRSYAVAFRTRQTVPDVLYYDAWDPYHYIRKEDGDVVIIGGNDHKTGQTEDERDHLQELKAYVEDRFGVQEYLAEWSAQVFETADGLPFIGKSTTHKQVYYATGYSGDGTLWGSFSGRLLADLVIGRPSKFAELFSPARLKLQAEAKEFLKENLNVAKEFVADRFQSDASDVKEVGLGEGKIVRQGIKQYAVYRDVAGALHVMSPTCVHMGCVVQWNTLEKTWDCPCHGGRYTATGDQLEGPPASGLRKAEL